MYVDLAQASSYLYVQSDLPHVHLVVSATVATFSAIVTVLICSSTGRVGF